jgi:hypothetical protein
MEITIITIITIITMDITIITIMKTSTSIKTGTVEVTGVKEGPQYSAAFMLRRIVPPAYRVDGGTITLKCLSEMRSSSMALSPQQ